MQNKSILMVAAENDALPGAKVGGVADVLRDLPLALKQKGYKVQSIIPSYGMLARLPEAKFAGQIYVEFAGQQQLVTFYRYQHDGADAWIADHPRFSPQGEKIYCHDDDSAPFATDATKYAFFCMVVAEALKQDFLPMPDIVHAHDWHAAFLLILMSLAPQYVKLSHIQTVFSIHNLAMQGVRPFRGEESSFERWYPKIIVDPRIIADPNYPHCMNPMRAGIAIADKVHTVSPSYAEEIQQRSDHALGIYGGEGLENDLRARAAQGQLFGILNGCNYDGFKATKALAKTTLVKLLQQSVLNWAASERQLRTAHWLADKRIAAWAASKKKKVLMTSVGRVTEQKVRLMTSSMLDGRSALGAMLEHGGSELVFLMLGSGDVQLERELVKISAEHENFIFLNGFAPAIADQLYAQGDLFLMPSSFEPCGISQLLAMREGQPCLVNSVGGLKDTVEHNVTGFSFTGDNEGAQAWAMLKCFEQCFDLVKERGKQYQSIKANATAARFSWDAVVDEYAEKLYC
ncbi:glycogen synthase [Agaribacterium haliotis]|uniref:glycogen synthase n=1 Tax=Agaribacterium haliotis TaxID=2013869 RepID=UPI001EFCC0A1|nr:glycogen/starch synthase [Agaribacterium haliotis]